MRPRFIGSDSKAGLDEVFEMVWLKKLQAMAPAFRRNATILRLKAERFWWETCTVKYVKYNNEQQQKPWWGFGALASLPNIVLELLPGIWPLVDEHLVVPQPRGRP